MSRTLWGSQCPRGYLFDLCFGPGGHSNTKSYQEREPRSPFVASVIDKSGLLCTNVQGPTDAREDKRGRKYHCILSPFAIATQVQLPEDTRDFWLVGKVRFSLLSCPQVEHVACSPLIALIDDNEHSITQRCLGGNRESSSRWNLEASQNAQCNERCQHGQLDAFHRR